MPRLACWLLAVAALAASAAARAADTAYLAELVAHSRELRLAERPEWLKLGHYVPNVGGPGVHSLVDSPNFFNAPRGKDDPRAELEATLAAFFAEGVPADVQHPQCAFVARYGWLDERLRFDRARMPRRDCRRYREWREALNAEHLTLVFASAYLNNPSSMYGHTLLRIDARDQDERTRLLAYTLNFAADTDEKNGLVFAVKGLLGGYPGTFSVLPYYLKVREYGDFENRDLWEYELDLSPEEVDRVLRHAWELLPAYFAYYFFDENCSYHLLGLLQVARPELQLSAPFRLWALPSDTVREVVRTPGLVRRVVYRPANSTVIERRIAGMPAQERRMARDLGLGRTRAEAAPLQALAPERAAAVLETGYDYLTYRRASGEREVADPQTLAHELLVARSRIDAPSQAPSIAPGVRPDEGHGTSRIAAGLGRRRGESYAELAYRPTYHDILDDDAGYARGAQIEFFDMRARHYARSGTRLESFTPIDILSLSPRDEFLRPKSWGLSAGWRRMLIDKGREPLVAVFDGMLGGTWSGPGGGLFYATAQASARAHHDLDHGYALGAGARVGALVDPLPRLRLHAYVEGLDNFAGERDRPGSIGLQGRWTLGRDAALKIDLSRRREAGQSFGAAQLSLHLYF
jgi:Domain of unknown function (DUF4105)